MTDTAMKQFWVNNLDCAACAAKIENRLSKLDGVDMVALDFASLTLHIKASDQVRLLEEIQKIEPDITLIPKSAARTKPDGATGHTRIPRKELWLLGIAVLLFAWQLFSESYPEHQPVKAIALMTVLIAYLAAGWNVLLNALRTIRKKIFFDENVLMVIATGGALAIGAYAEAIGVMIFYKIGEILQQRTVARSRKSIRSLLAIRPDKAVLITPEGYRDVAPETVRVGQQILVRPGEKIPLDGVVLSGNSQVDASALTGESVPLSTGPGDWVLAGQINAAGALTIRVTKVFQDSSIAKVMALVETATARKAKTEKFITTFARYYTPAVVAIAACIAFIPPLVSATALFETWIYRALVLLVISCPCALMVSIPLGYFGGIGRASRNGILVKGSNYIDALAAVDTVVFDKTGTLTRGVFKVREVVNLNGFSTAELLEFAAAAESHSTHPIAASIRAAFTASGGNLDAGRISGHVDLAGRGVTVRYGDHTILVGSDQLLHQHAIEHQRCDFDSTVAHIVVDEKYAGYLTIGDEIRPDAKAALEKLKSQGVEQIVMLTGDNQCAAEAVAQKLGIRHFYADLLPEDKVARFEKLQSDKQNNKKIAFVGDGINDAPVIARADVGIAMGALGSDAAIETADVVLMTDSPMKLVQALSIARQTRKVVWQNIGLAFIIKGIFITFGAFGLATMWEAVFADMGTALLAVLNATRTLGGKY